MLLRHWMKAGLVFLYLVAILWVLNQCSRFFEPAPRPIPVKNPEFVPVPHKEEAPPKSESKTSISDRAKERVEPKTATSCVSAFASSRDLAVFVHPDLAAPVLTHLRPGQCGLVLMRRTQTYSHVSGWTALAQIAVEGKTGWVRESVINQRPPHLAAPRRYCVNGARLQGARLPLLIDPHPRAPVIARISPTSCRLAATGREAGQGRWLEVTHDYGYTGWVSAYYLQPVR